MTREDATESPFDMRWSVFLRFIKDLEEKIKAMKYINAQFKDKKFSEIYTDKMKRVFVDEEVDHEGYVHSYIKDKGGWGRDNTTKRDKRIELINRYFTAIDGSWTSVYSAFDFKYDEYTNLLKMASDKDMETRNIFNFLPPPTAPEAAEDKATAAEAKAE